MADIAALFEEELIPVAIKHPRTGREIGIVMHIAPFEADATVNWWIRSSAQMERIKTDGNVTVDRIAEIDAKAIVKRAILSVRKWEWNGNSFGALGKDPACTLENKTAVLGDPHSSWIVDQIIEAAATAENFTKPPEVDLSNTSASGQDTKQETTTD